jgi:hypothetical protein
MSLIGPMQEVTASLTRMQFKEWWLELKCGAWGKLQKGKGSMCCMLLQTPSSHIIPLDPPAIPHLNMKCSCRILIEERCCSRQQASKTAACALWVQGVGDASTVQVRREWGKGSLYDQC